MSKSNVMSLILVLCLVLVGSGAGADEVNHSAVEYFAVGLLLVDIGASVGNGIALTTGRPNRLNGYLGVVAGIVSLGLVAVDFAATDDKDLRDSFALVFGAAGTASLVLGAMTVHRSPPTRERVAGISGIGFFPYLTLERDHRYGIGVGAQMKF